MNERRGGVRHWLQRRLALQDLREVSSPEQFEEYLRKHPEYVELWESALGIMRGEEPQYGRRKFGPKEDID
jgi:hypothetical protein